MYVLRQMKAAEQWAVEAPACLKECAPELLLCFVQAIQADALRAASDLAGQSEGVDFGISELLSQDD